MSEKVDYQLRRKVWIGIFLGLLAFWGAIATIVTLALA
ncbi:TPA: YmiA family putative membrane protein [Klebsiella aerogenes]|nr:YmiA family putative membrane protein [Klebsiella aerogenes]EKU7808794.1 YmiA family putative membrane protein [Klebsiella aerogenes]EKV3390235.1 YmiA family putative membrane protein [Klebsiella aerogenes]ELA2168442.1 YmiA family putative membrane protein [Klebsiella aerogenes]ELA2807302.1 YmiA family putative membrane protein [Klebsiella aerogenes]